jgi:hypothetical protein
MSLTSIHQQSAIRTLDGHRLGSASRPYRDRLEDGADLVEGKAERKSPTIKQAAADVNVCSVALWKTLRARGWHDPRRRPQPEKWPPRGARQLEADLRVLHGIAYRLGTDAIVAELVAINAPAVPMNGNGAAVARANGAGQHVHHA